ncbi:MAG: hypothetical protein U0176_16335 [Bacteroidia bacterium]
MDKVHAKLVSAMRALEALVCHTVAGAAIAPQQYHLQINITVAKPSNSVNPRMSVSAVIKMLDATADRP